MPFKLDLDKGLLREALEMLVSSRIRAAKGANNALIKEILEKDIAIVNAAIPTITETK